MLGKTNITVLSEGVTAEEIEQMQSGIQSDFIKCVSGGGYLAAVTEDGNIVFSSDGDVWNVLKLEYEECRLHDIEWDGKRFLLAGGCKDAGLVPDETIGFIAATTDFKTLVRMGNLQDEDSKYYNEYYAVFSKNGQYAVAARCRNYVYILRTDFTQEGTSASNLLNQYSTPARGCISAKNTDGMILHFRTGTNTVNQSEKYISVLVREKGQRDITSSTTAREANVIECKDALYVMALAADKNYELIKIVVPETGETAIVCTGQKFAFSSGVYFNSWQLFINAHEMLVLRKGESLADKTLEDLIEISPEAAMRCITKAFGQLYIFGNQGLILRSNEELDNEGAVAVQTLSAKRALAEAKAYADAGYKELETRIAALEAR